MADGGRLCARRGALARMANHCCSTWIGSEVDVAKKKLKMRVLRRIMMSGLLSVNFDPALVALLCEVRFLLIFYTEMPQAALNMLNRASTFRKQVAQLDRIVQMYSAVLTELLPVEEPLLEDRIERIDAALAPGLMDLECDHQDRIFEFIEGGIKFVSEVKGVVDVMKGNLRHISGILSGWCKEPRLQRRPGAKPISMDEFNAKYKEPLLEDRIEKIDAALAPGLMDLKRNHQNRIPEFIEGVMKVVSDVRHPQGACSFSWLTVPYGLVV